MSEIEAAELQEALEWTLAQVQGNVAEFRETHTDAETVVAIRQDFINLAFVRAYGDHGSSIVGDYVGFGLALLRLLDARKQIIELTDQLEMHKAVISTLSEIEDL